MLEEGTPLVPGRMNRRTNLVVASVMGLAAVAAVAVCAFALVANQAHRTVLDTDVSINCDGSMDITTDILAPCASMFPAATAVVPGAPYWAPPAVYPPPGPALPAAPMAPAPYWQVGPNAYQLPTVWSGDHTLSGGQAEWAAEDAAQHALNLANWRIKLLKAKKEQAKLTGEVMEAAADKSLDEDTKKAAPAKAKTAKKAAVEPASLEDIRSTSAELDDIKKSFASLASDTSTALQDLQTEVSNDKRSGKKVRAETLSHLKKDTDAELASVMGELDGLTHKYDEEEAEDRDYFDQ
mmetsp:Transcript_21169/g.42722  ORF Transcript_21169/g.42722 Transcript_21169/m.42722 type:complete len:295 (+) Transcript_21169:29-913(+)